MNTNSDPKPFLESEAAAMWQGQFGDEYTERNRVDWRARVPFWRSAIGLTRPNHVLEVGANEAWNLRAIREASPGTYVEGIDINLKAALAAKRDGYDVDVREASEAHRLGRTFDLVFTAGVLIHVSPRYLRPAMESIVAASRRYVLAIEYAAEQEEMVHYRGHDDRLWRRPFGDMYQLLGLVLRATGPAGQGFDSCTYWLMEKP